MSGVADVSIHTGGDDPKQVSRTIGPNDNIKIFVVGDGEINALQHIIRTERSGAEVSDVTTGIKIGAGQGTSGALDAEKDDSIDARERIVEFIVEEINSSYPRVWEAVQARDPHL